MRLWQQSIRWMQIPFFFQQLKIDGINVKALKCYIRFVLFFPDIGGEASVTELADKVRRDFLRLFSYVTRPSTPLCSRDDDWIRISSTDVCLNRRERGIEAMPPGYIYASAIMVSPWISGAVRCRSGGRKTGNGVWLERKKKKNQDKDRLVGNGE